jgi:DNA polymerase-1
MIAGYLQNGEKVVMAHANVLWRKELDKLGIRYRQVNLVHDEFQTNIIGTEAEARKAGEVQSEAIKQTGINLGIVCPLAGEYKIGKDWLETH